MTKADFVELHVKALRKIEKILDTPITADNAATLGTEIAICECAARAINNLISERSSNNVKSV